MIPEPSPNRCEVTMRHMMLMYSRETPEGPSSDDVEYLISTNGALTTEAKHKGVRIAVERLRPTRLAEDAFGHDWSIAAHVDYITPEKMHRRMQS